MAFRPEEVSSIIQKEIEGYEASLEMESVGTILQVGDGIAHIHGLSGVKYNELLEFPHGVIGLALNLEEESVGAIVLGEYAEIKEGDEVKCTGRIVEVPAGDDLHGGLGPQQRVAPDRPAVLDRLEQEAGGGALIGQDQPPVGEHRGELIAHQPAAQDDGVPAPGEPLEAVTIRKRHAGAF